MLSKAAKDNLMIVGGFVLLSGVAALSWYLSSYKRKAVREALEHEGVTETANNSGFQDKAFQKMMSDVGWRSGDQWCMYFAKMVWVNAYKKDAEMLGKLLSGSSQGSYEAAVKDGGKNVTVEKDPKPGDIVIFQRYSGGKPQYKGHAGIVFRVHGDKGFTTIEGNTNEEGSSEGTIVSKKERTFNWDTTNGLRLRGFIRKRV